MAILSKKSFDIYDIVTVAKKNSASQVCNICDHIYIDMLLLIFDIFIVKWLKHLEIKNITQI